MLHLDLAHGSMCGSCSLAAAADCVRLTLLYLDQTLETSVMVRGEVVPGPQSNVSSVLCGSDKHGGGGVRDLPPQQMLVASNINRAGRLSSEDLSKAMLPPALKLKVLYSGAKLPCMLSKLTGLQQLLLP